MDTTKSSKRRGRRCVQWQLLPPEIFAQVFSHLPDSDRCRARLTCSYWRDVFLLPELWRKRKHVFKGRDNKEGWRAARYMEMFGPHLRHLNLEIGMPVVQNARIISLGVAELLNCKPRGMKLQTLTCYGLEYFNTPLYRIIIQRSRILNALCNILRRQKSLEEVNLSCSQMGKEEGCRLLKALTTHNAKPKPGSKNPGPPASLTFLELRDFFLEDINVVECPAFQEEMGRFSALRHLGLNFTYLSETVLEKLSGGSPGLESLSLSMDGSHLLQVAHLTFNNLLASPEGWRAGVQRCPKLRVMVDMRGRFRLLDFQRVLVPGMPLVSLSVTSLIASLYFESNQMMDHIANMLDYLCQHFAGSLKIFHLEWGDRQETWSRPTELVELVRCCPSLTWLSMQMALPIDTLLRVAAAANQHSTKLPASVPLRIHLGGCDCTLGKRALKRLSAVNPTCSAHICNGCLSKQYQAAFD